VVHRDDITCHISDRLGDVVNKVRATGKEACIVTTEEGVVLGRIHGKTLEDAPNALVEDVMESGPTTVRN
jgi:hypothetical protein